MTGVPAEGDREPAPEALTRITLRPIASPLPLGLLALAGGTLLLSGLQQVGWVEPAESHTLGSIIIAFVAPLQFLSAILLFRCSRVCGCVGLRA